MGSNSGKVKNSHEANNSIKIRVGELLSVGGFIELFYDKLRASSNPELRSLSKLAAKELHTLLVKSIAQALLAGRKVRFKELGTFSTKYRGPRTFRTPKDPKAKINSPATVTVQFKLSTNLKYRIQLNDALVEAHQKAAAKAGK